MNDWWAHDVMTIGVPTIAVLVGVLINNNQISDRQRYFDGRLNDVNSRLNELNSRLYDVKSELRAELLRVEGVLDARLRHVEERLGIR